MTYFIKDKPLFPVGSLDGRPRSNFPSKSAEMVNLLKTLPSDKIIELVKETDDPMEFERKRSHWSTTAKRAGIKIVTKIMKNEVGDKVLRIWRMS